MKDPRILSPERIEEIRAEVALHIFLGELSPHGIADALLIHIEGLTEQATDDRAVIDAAENLVANKREAAKAFPQGLRSVPGLVQNSGAHRMIARRVMLAGVALERALDRRALKVS